MGSTISLKEKFQPDEFNDGKKQINNEMLYRNCLKRMAKHKREAYKISWEIEIQLRLLDYYVSDDLMKGFSQNIQSLKSVLKVLNRYKTQLEYLQRPAPEYDMYEKRH